MRWKINVSEMVKAGVLAGCLLLSVGWPPDALAQQGETPPTGAKGDFLRDLESRLSELNAALAEVRAEVARSRQESLELRHELHETRDQLASLRSELREGRGPVSLPVPPETGAAQTSGPGEESGGDHVDERLARIEEEQQLLSGKINEQHQTKVESASKYRLRLSGIALLNIFGNRGSVDNLDLPNLARRKRTLESGGAFGASLRQSMLGLEVFGPRIGGAKTGAEVQFDFFGGFPDTFDGVASGLVRLRTATIHFDWPHTSLVAGQDAPFFSPLAPTSLASLAYPAFSYSGNLWTWIPQVRIERRISVSEGSDFVIQGGILDSYTGEPPYGQFNRLPQAGERSRQPAYAVRTAWSGKAWGRPLTLGVGGYYARQNWGLGRTVDGWAGTADWSVPITPWLLLTGEFYRGRALGGLGAGYARSVLFSDSVTNPDTEFLGLNSTGGWSQLKFRATERLEFNSAFGQDVPSGRDLARFIYSPQYVDGLLARNQSGFFNVIYRLRSNLLVSAEYRRLWTSTNLETKETADHLNFGIGVLF